LSVILDVEELIPGPGTSWKLVRRGWTGAEKGGGFRRFRGRLAKIRPASRWTRRSFFEGGWQDLRWESPHGAEGQGSRTVEVPLEAIRKANLVVEF